MRQIAILSICSVFILGTVAAYAAPVGNIATASALKKGLLIGKEDAAFGITLGPEADLITDHKLKHQAKDTRYNFYGGKAGLLINNKAFLYGLIGLASAEQKYKISGAEVEWQTDNDTAYGGGATIILYEKDVVVREKGILRVGLDGRYRTSDLGVDEVILSGTTYKSSDTALTNAEFKCNEWQLAFEVSYQADRVIPYGGFKWIDMSGEAKATISGKEYEQSFDPKSNGGGIFAGMDFLIGDSASVNIEVRAIDEVAFSAGGVIRF